MSENAKSKIDAVQRTCRILKALIANDVNGITLTQLSLITEIPAPKLHRDLDSLEKEEFVQKEGEIYYMGKIIPEMFRLYLAGTQQLFEHWTDKFTKRIGKSS